MNVLVVGAGMYVTGRGTDGPGTILPAIAEFSRCHQLSSVAVCGTSLSSRESVLLAAAEINNQLGTSLAVSYSPFPELGPGDLRGFDCAVVSVPDHVHAEVVEPLIGAGLHVLVVKPLAPTLAAAQRLERLAAHAGVHAVVEFHKRLDEQVLAAKRLLREGAIGKPTYGTVAYSQQIAIPSVHFKDWAHKTNVFQYIGVHYVDLFHFMTGLVPCRALAVGHRGVLADLGVDTFDSVHAVITWSGEDDDQFITQFTVGWIDPNSSPATSDQRFTLVGSKGRLEVDQMRRGLELVSGEDGVVQVNPHFSQFYPYGDRHQTFGGYGPRSIEEFLQDVEDLMASRVDVEELRDVRPTFADALVSTSVIDAVNSSLRSGGEWRDVG